MGDKRALTVWRLVPPLPWVRICGGAGSLLGSVYEDTNPIRGGSPAAVTPRAVAVGLGLHVGFGAAFGPAAACLLRSVLR